MARPPHQLDNNELRRRVCNEVQRAVHMALAHCENERRFLVPYEDVLDRAECFLRQSGMCAEAIRRTRLDGRAREILTHKREALTMDLWTQTLLLQYDPLARDVREIVAHIVRTTEPKSMRELVLRFAATYPSAARPTCPHGTLTFTTPGTRSGGDVGSKPPQRRRSWADIARSAPPSPAAFSGGCLVRYCFPSQATWAAFRLYAHEWYRPLVDHADKTPEGEPVTFVERARWGDFSADAKHSDRIRNHVASSLNMTLVQYAPPSPDSETDENAMTASCDLEDLRSGLPPLWAMTPSPSTTPTPSDVTSSPASSPPVGRTWGDMCCDD